MCGLFQVFLRQGPVDGERFHRSLAMLRHRGPDYTGELAHEAFRVRDGRVIYGMSGHQRLSIVDLDPRSHQPFGTAETSLIYNGEIYNFRALRRDFADTAQFKTESDTEVLFHGLKHEGTAFLSRLNGMWAFSYLDTPRRRLLLSRDRHGKKPLFLYKDSGCICVSSSISSILQFVGISGIARRDQIESFLITGYLLPPPAATTYLRDIEQVPPGSVVTIDLDSWTSETSVFFDVRAAVSKGLPANEPLAEVLADAVRVRLYAERNMGLLLSGGIDSSLVLSIVQALGANDRLRCYIGDTPGNEDAAYAKRSAEQLGFETRVVDFRDTEITFDHFLRISAHQEKPFPLIGSTMAMAVMYKQIASDDVAVVLDGTGGDEIFGGYWDRYFPAAVMDAAVTSDFRWLAMAFEASPHIARDLAPILRERAGRRELRRLLEDLTGQSQTRRSTSKPSEVLKLKRNLDTALLADVAPGGRLGEWIWHNDRNAMMYGVENRSPILDYRLLPWIGSGYRRKMQGRWNKLELRLAFDSFVPLPTQWRRQKQGFRWNRTAFIRENREPILDLIRNSSLLADFLSIATYVDKCRSNSARFDSPLTGRLLSVAAVGESLGLRRIA